MAIERKVKGWDPPRPLTHDLIESLIRTMGGEMERLVINDLQDGTYYAEINVRLDNKLIMVDCRPSDGIALAVRANAPIFVEESVLEKASSQE
jgi:bifunctional DNase/RNase